MDSVIFTTIFGPDNNNEPLTSTATNGGGAQVINHGTVSLTDNRLL